MMLAPAQLWVGKQEVTNTHAQEFLQKIFCRHQSCAVCSDCRAIRQQQHHAIMWVRPEKAYTQEDLAPLFHALSFALDEDQRMFFVLDKADFLTPTCANSLLKSLEEPPRGFHFILLAERPDALLPTIRSRCITQNFYDAAQSTTHATLLAFLCTTKTVNPLAFAQELDTNTPTEQETICLLDAVLAHWLAVYKQSVESQDAAVQTRAAHKVALCKKAITLPPMPGSSKLLWRTLFLEVHASH